MTVRGEVQGLEASGGARGATHQGGAGDLKAECESEVQGGAREEGTKRLKGAFGDRAEDPDGIGRIGGSGMLGGSNNTDLVQCDETDLGGSISD